MSRSTPGHHCFTAVSLSLTYSSDSGRGGAPLAGQFCSVILGVISGDPAKGLLLSPSKQTIST